jgi:Spy/CpxP family protein refolding chaperone
MFIFLAAVGSSVAQVGQVSQRSQLGSLQRYLFSPDLVMRNQDVLALTEEQRGQMVQVVQQAQASFTELNWNLQNEVQSLTTMFEDSATEEAGILEQFDAVLDLERQVKRTHLVLALRMRNILDDEQLGKLDDLRRKRGKNLRERWSSLKKQR